jgi:hypothetical protein
MISPTLAMICFMAAVYLHFKDADWQFMAFLALFNMAAAGYFK